MTSVARTSGLLAGGLLVLAACTSTVGGTASPAAPPVEPVTLEDVQVAGYAAGQQHVTTDVDYDESPPVGGPHDAAWADCTGSVYDVEIRPENAVHSLEHGAVWITYDPDLAADADVAALESLVAGSTGLMMSPYPGLGTVVSLQAWNNRLALDSVDDPRLIQFVELLTFNQDVAPEPGASCENPRFLANPLTP